MLFLKSQSCFYTQAKKIGVDGQTFYPTKTRVKSEILYLSAGKGERGEGGGHGGRWSNRTYVALALFSLLATCVVSDLTDVVIS